MPDSLKIMPLSDAAFRAYVTSICFAARNLTDGFVPLKKAKEFGGRARIIQELVPSLWEVAEGGFMVHDYLQYNPTRETVLDEREKAKARMSAARSGDVRPNIGRSSLSPTTTPPRPTPGLEKPLVSLDGGGGRRNVFLLCEEVFGAESITAFVSEELKAWEDEHPPACLEHCFKAAAMKSPRPSSINWVKAMLETHRREGCETRPKAVVAAASAPRNPRYDE